MDKLKKIWGIASTVLVVLVVICAVLLMGARLLGFQCYSVISGSMEPTYSVGDLLYVKKVNPLTIQVGDPITFVMNEDLVVATHRVVRVDAANQRFYTKGDANEIMDQDPVHYNNVVGVPKFALPKLGYVSDFVQNPPGTYIAIGICVFLMIIVFLPDMLNKKKPEKAEQADDAEEADAKTEKADPPAEESEALKSLDEKDSVRE